MSRNVLADTAREALRILAWQMGWIVAVAFVGALAWSWQVALAIAVGGGIGSIWTMAVSGVCVRSHAKASCCAGVV